MSDRSAVSPGRRKSTRKGSRRSVKADVSGDGSSGTKARRKRSPLKAKPSGSGRDRANTSSRKSASPQAKQKAHSPVTSSSTVTSAVELTSVDPIPVRRGSSEENLLGKQEAVNESKSASDDPILTSREAPVKSFPLARKPSKSLLVSASEDQLDMLSRQRTPWSCSKLIPHNSVFKTYWDLFLSLLILYTVIIIPMDFAFEPFPPGWEVGMEVFLTAGFAFNILVYFRTSVETTDAVIKDPWTIARMYLKGWFWLDLLATVPWDLILRAALGGDDSAYKVLRIVRLVRAVRLFSGDQFNLTYSKTTVRLLKLVAYAMCAAHWLGCVWYALSEYENFTGNGFVAGPSFINESFSYSYLICLHWGVWSLISMGSELRPDSTPQALLALVVIIGGVAVFATIIGNIEVLLAQTAASSIKFHEKINQLNDFFQHHRLSGRLEKHIMRHIHHVYRTRRGLNEDELLAQLPTETRNKVYRALYKKELRRCAFFKECDDAFIDALCSEIKPEVALRGDIIIRQGSLGSEMYIIHRGEAEAVDLATGEVHSHIAEGRFFGEIALFTNSKRTISVRACTFMELFVLPKHRFLRVLEFFPEEEKRFIHVARKRVKTTEDLAKSVASSVSPSHGVWDAAAVQEFYSANNLDHLKDVFHVSDVADFIAKFDTNGDGVLDVEERQHIVEYLNAWAERLKVMGALDMRQAQQQGGITNTALSSVGLQQQRLRGSYTDQHTTAAIRVPLPQHPPAQDDAARKLLEAEKKIEELQRLLASKQ